MYFYFVRKCQSRVSNAKIYFLCVAYKVCATLTPRMDADLDYFGFPTPWQGWQMCDSLPVAKYHPDKPGTIKGWLSSAATSLSIYKELSQLFDINR